jgi:hypothetical protein
MCRIGRERVATVAQPCLHLGLHSRQIRKREKEKKKTDQKKNHPSSFALHGAAVAKSCAIDIKVDLY